jgi:hypothetical protein
LKNWNYAGPETFVSKFPDFKQWFDDLDTNLKVKPFGITNYKRFIFSRIVDDEKSDNDKIEVWCYKETLTRTEALSFWNNPKFSMSTCATKIMIMII